MSRVTVSQGDRRVLTLGAIVLIGLIGLGRAAPMLVRWSSERAAQAAMQQRRLQEVSAAIMDAPANVRDAAVMRRTLQGADSLLLPATSGPTAGAALAELVAVAADDAGLALGSVEIEDMPAPVTPFARTSVRATVVGELQAVAYFVASLEVGPELLRVKEATIARTPGGFAPPAPAEVTVNLVISGIFRPRAGGRR